MASEKIPLSNPTSRFKAKVKFKVICRLGFQFLALKFIFGCRITWKNPSDGQKKLNGIRGMEERTVL